MNKGEQDEFPVDLRQCRDAVRNLIGVAVDQIPDEEDLFYTSLNIASMLGLVE